MHDEYSPRLEVRISGRRRHTRAAIPPPIPRPRRTERNARPSTDHLFGAISMTPGRHATQRCGTRQKVPRNMDELGDRLSAAWCRRWLHWIRRRASIRAHHEHEARPIASRSSPPLLPRRVDRLVYQLSLKANRR
ncbi:hypothetical protein AKJ09_10610 [Labilithrix luteola]|uniref:Uncharacterized protein n=1 Tax=Labilithrix luteola TaxID=1391654 RepID=A0A0K1QE56_9BACT|nr:hypothetical protein AKJ09_10610 [Labilithrix luteola]